jgi:hypothetical protein
VEGVGVCGEEKDWEVTTFNGKISKAREQRMKTAQVKDPGSAKREGR